MQRISRLKKVYYLFLEQLRLQKKKKEFLEFKKKSGNSTRFAIDWNDRFIYLNEDTEETWFDTHYIFHPAWAARAVQKYNPEFHVDISSTLNFCAIVSAFLPVRFYDYRPANLNFSNLVSGKEDLTQLSFADKSIQSLSCMHVIEHIGLGRYGDPLDPEGDIKALAELKRVVAVGGQLIIASPVGKPRIQWNAHRIYSYELITNFILEGGDFTVEEFSLIPDNALQTGILYNADPALVQKQSYACGCWVFKRIK